MKNNKMEKRAVFWTPKNHENVCLCYNTALLVLGISKEDFKGFWNLCKLSRVVFNRCNRGFYKFPAYATYVVT